MNLLTEFKTAFQRRQNAHVQLILINVIVFLCFGVFYVATEISGYSAFFNQVYNQFSIPPVLSDYLQRPWTILSYGFTHSYQDIFHILFNMIALYWFGSLIVEYLGSARLVSIYIMGTLFAAVVYLVLYNSVPYFIARSQFSGMVGASGAVFAIMTAAATLLPDYSFYLLFFGSVRIKYIVLVYILISFLGSVGHNAGGNLAHLGGALFGFIFIKQLQAGNDWGKWIAWIQNGIKKLTTPSPKIRVTHRRQPEKSNSPSQEEIDAILDKISAGGYQTLTSEEKEKLFRAGKS